MLNGLMNWKFQYHKLASLALDVKRNEKYYRKISELYEIIDIGCKKHRQYKGHLKPCVDCEECRKIYEARQELNELKKEFHKLDDLIIRRE